MIFKCDNLLPHQSNDYLYDILRARGIEDPERYLNVTDAVVTDGFMLENMQEAIDAVAAAITSGHSIAITVDSDVDGYTSAAIIWLYLKAVADYWRNPGNKMQYFIHSGKQHGIDDLIDQIEEFDPRLIIVPDASSSELEIHKQYVEDHPNCKIIVLDHHLSDVEDDPYCIRVNNQLSPNFPNKTLCGAGIVYKFCQCFDDYYGLDLADNFLDLTAVGLVADMMDLRNEETHYLIQRGLNDIHNPGLVYFVESLSYSLGGKTKLDPVDVAFYIAPYINAVIRVGTQDIKTALFEALLDGTRVVQSTKRGAKTGDTEILGEQAARLAKNAKALQERLIEKALDVLEAKIFKLDLLENKILLIPINDEDGVHSSLTGLVAMKLAAKYHRPTLILRECDDGFLKGSIRAEEGTALGGFKEYLDSTGLFDYVQGHSQAAGASIKESNVGDFINFANGQLEDIDFNEKAYAVDYVFNADEDLTYLIRDLDAGTHLYGQNIKEPLFGVQNIPLKKTDVTIMKNNCMKFVYNGISYVIFKNPEAIEDFTQYDRMMVTICGRANMNEWLGRKTCQVIITAYEVKKDIYTF